MTELFLERRFDPPLDVAAVASMALESRDCFDRHRVEWQSSFLAADGYRMVCWFRSPDMESARIALRQSNADMRVLWRGTVHDKPGLDEGELAAANVLVERRFDEGVTLQQIQDIEDAGIWCLETRDVHFVRTFFALDRKRMICLYRAPDAESVRLAQRQAGVPFNDAWSFRVVVPAHLENASV